MFYFCGFQSYITLLVARVLFFGCQPGAAIRTISIVMPDSDKPLQFTELHQGMRPICGGNGCRLGKEMTKFPNLT